MIFAICVLLALVGIGIVIGAICAVCAALLVALGVVSSATLLALLRRRLSTGFRALHYQFTVLMGLPSGAAAGYFGAGFLHLSFRQREVLLWGAVGGAAAAGLLALASDYAVSLAYRRLAGLLRS